MARVLSVLFKGDSKDIESAFGRIESRTQAIGKKLSSFGSTMTKSVTLPIVGALGLATKAAAEEEQEMAVLANTLRNTVKATDQQVKATERWVTKMQNATGFADSQLRPALGKLTIAGRSVEQSQKDLAVAMDIARARGLDLDTVTTAMAKAAMGNVTSLQRMGIATKNAAGETLTYDEILKAAAGTMGGAAAAAADTSAGKAEILKQKMADLTEQIGTALLPHLDKIVGFLGKLAEKFSALSEPTQNAILIMMGITAVSGPILSITGKLTSLAGFLLTGLTPAATTASAAIGGGGAVATGAGASAASLAGGLLAATAAGALLGIGLHKLIETHFPEFNDVLEDFGGWIYDKVIPALNAWGGKLFDIWNWGNKIRDQRTLEMAGKERAPSGFSSLKRFQHGGYVPAGVTQPALLHGPEWVIPGHRMNGGSAPAPTGDVVIKIGEEEFARIQIASLLRYQRANGNLGLT